MAMMTTQKTTAEMRMQMGENTRMVFNPMTNEWEKQIKTPKGYEAIRVTNDGPTTVSDYYNANANNPVRSKRDWEQNEPLTKEGVIEKYKVDKYEVDYTYAYADEYCFRMIKKDWLKDEYLIFEFKGNNVTFDMAWFKKGCEWYEGQ